MSRSVSVPSGAFAVAYRTDAEDYEDFGWYIENLQEQIRMAFPSFQNANSWVGREDHVIAENRFAQFGISEYMGLVSLWLVLKEALDDREYGLAKGWAKSAKIKFDAKFAALRKVATFSNGEAVYERIKK